MKGSIRWVIALIACAFAILAALAELVSEGAFSEEKALELARMYLHDNAAKLYGAKL
jgi:predicted outer membrane lipoprotein